MGFITLANEYYEGDRREASDLEIPQRPTPGHIWQGSQWLFKSVPNWKGLELELTGTFFFAKAFQLASPKSFSLLLTTVTSTHNLDTLPFAIDQLRATMKADFSSAEITQLNTILKNNNFEIQIPEARSFVNVEPEVVPTTVAIYKNLNDPQVVEAKVPLKVDGLHPSTFSQFNWLIWDANTAKFTPSQAGENYSVRVTFFSTSLVSTVIEIELSAGSTIISSAQTQPFKLTDCPNTFMLDFYVRQQFVTTGLTLNIQATASTTIKETTLYIKRLPLTI